MEAQFLRPCRHARQSIRVQLIARTGFGMQEYLERRGICLGCKVIADVIPVFRIFGGGIIRSARA
jgi:hypothetical protein